jgi:hypothetical protein
MLSAKLKKAPGALTVTLKGPLDEQCGAPLAALAEKIERVHVTFDCMAVTAVNSIGFRVWLEFLKGLAERVTFEFVNCPAPFVDYAGLLKTTAYANRIVSVQVPFRCNGCERESASVFEVDAVAADDAEFPPGVCRHCNGMTRALMTPGECLSGLS